MNKFLILSSILSFFTKLSLQYTIYKDIDKHEDYNNSEFDIIYDQKQNGSYNIRFGVEGLDVLLNTELNSKILNPVVEVIASGGLSAILDHLPEPSSSSTTESEEDFFASVTPTVVPTSNNKTEIDLQKTQSELSTTVVSEAASIP
ncbi:hypothetical protein WA026_016037 [Henosepilachna vigintioctopunctata]|uniref:Uncharacterized protein n=1 Tax=Henosepilachna vigintioctopunctata TaxID=420089 RepID=A0AAW1UAF0_9CUCU